MSRTLSHFSSRQGLPVVRAPCAQPAPALWLHKPSVWGRSADSRLSSFSEHTIPPLPEKSTRPREEPPWPGQALLVRRAAHGTFLKRSYTIVETPSERDTSLWKGGDDTKTQSCTESAPDFTVTEGQRGRVSHDHPETEAERGRSPVRSCACPASRHRLYRDCLFSVLCSWLL